MLLQRCKIKLYERMKSVGISYTLLSANVILLPCPLNILKKGILRTTASLPNTNSYKRTMKKSFCNTSPYSIKFTTH